MRSVQYVKSDSQLGLGVSPSTTWVKYFGMRFLHNHQTTRKPISAYCPAHISITAKCPLHSCTSNRAGCSSRLLLCETQGKDSYFLQTLRGHDELRLEQHVHTLLIFVMINTLRSHLFLKLIYTLEFERHKKPFM